MGFIAWIIVGLIAGALAKLIMPGRDPGGIFVTIIIGILGGMLGGFLGTRFLGWGDVSGIDFRTIGISTVGAILLLIIYRMVKKR
ncbi:MAG: GlsB/YeaQ/YmgE family stress response membrane protein [Verrucomicrobiales bacterium]|nr:GlsB/YeaQ/YmgE family stress response membrane protein [Verrucomicrobiales bacterium]